MSIKLMSEVWEKAEVSGSELLVLLALADYANDDGTSIYPSMQAIAKKARMSSAQARRIIHKLIAQGLVELVELGGWDGRRNRANEYRIVSMGGTSKLQAPNVDARGGTSTRARGGTNVDASTVLASMQDQSSYKHHAKPPLQPTADRGAVHTCWQQNIPGTLTPIIGEQLDDLIDDFGADGVIRAITVAVNANVRTMRYIKGVLEKEQNGGTRAPTAANKSMSVQRMEGEEW